VNSQPAPITALNHTLDNEPQQITAPLTHSAAFLVLEVKDDADSIAKVREVLGSTDDLIKNTAIREIERTFTCNVAIGHRVWQPLVGTTPPRELKPFREIKGATHTAVSTPGDLLYHIRARTMDLIVAFERNLLMAFGDAVETVDDVAGFRYFDGRDLLDFVDGTANPEGLSLPEATIVGDEDPDHAGGSYVVVQKYLHNLDMPFANPGRGEYGTYFIGYTRRLWVIETMLERMFIGNPAPLHDRILDFSTATTGVTFFAPSRKVLADLGE